MKKFLNTALAALAFAWLWASHAEAMDIEVRPPFVVLSGNVTGIELRILKNAIDEGNCERAIGVRLQLNFHYEIRSCLRTYLLAYKLNQQIKLRPKQLPTVPQHMP